MQCALAYVPVKENTIGKCRELQKVSMLLLLKHGAPGEADQCLPFLVVSKQLLINSRYGKNFLVVALKHLTALKWGLCVWGRSCPCPAASASYHNLLQILPLTLSTSQLHGRHLLLPRVPVSFLFFRCQVTVCFGKPTSNSAVFFPKPCLRQ